MSNVVAPEEKGSTEDDPKKVAKAVGEGVKIAGDIAEASGAEMPDLDTGDVPVGTIAKTLCCLCKKAKKNEKKKDKGLKHDVTKVAIKLAVVGLKEAFD